MNFIANNIRLIVLICALALGAGIVTGLNFGYRQTYDPSQGVNPLSAILVSHADLRSASSCASDVVGASMRNGLRPTRSDLFYAEWRCDIAARNANKHP